MRLPARILLVLIGLLTAGAAAAEDLLMARSRQPFPEAMLSLQEAIGDAGYTLSRVQRVDIGLTNFGYETDKYRVVFFGRPAEVRRLSGEHPELVPYLPLKVAIFAEGGDTLLVAANPLRLEEFYHQPELHAIFARWERDLRTIFDRVREAE